MVDWRCVQGTVWDRLQSQMTLTRIKGIGNGCIDGFPHILSASESLENEPEREHALSKLALKKHLLAINRCLSCFELS